MREPEEAIPRQELKAFAEIYARVAEFFQNTRKTTAWFRARNPLLGGLRPVEMLLSGRAQRLLRFVRQTEASLSTPMPREIALARKREIDRREANINTLAARTVPWAEVRARLRRKSKRVSGL
jgi:hypothetical protein